MTHPVADILHRTAEENLQDPRRRGNLVHLNHGCDVIVAGDIHGNRAGLGKIIRFADLPNNPQRRLILQELIHGPPDAQTGRDRSIEQLMRGARVKLAHPRQVVLLLGNHDLAQVTGNEITKDGMGVVKAFNEAVRFEYDERADEILDAVREFLLSIPLAAKTPGGVFMSHSLPSPDRMELAGMDIMDRSYRDQDLRRGGSAYEWTWGRNQTDEQLETLTEQLEVEFFVLGHRHLATGRTMIGKWGIAVDCSNPNGCIVQFSSDESLTSETVTDHIKPIARLDPDVP